MTATPQFQPLRVKRVSPEAAGAVAVAFDVPAALRDTFRFEPGQFITLKAAPNGEEVRRNYSISSTRRRLAETGEIEIGVRPVEGGLVSNWLATAVAAGDTLSVMPPEGRFVIKRARAMHRVGFAAGSGITPILSIAATSLEEQTQSKFTLVYGNKRMASVMFNEALQDLKDRYPDRFTMLHILSRQSQEVDLLQGRIDEEKVKAIAATLLPIASMDEVFVCGPEAMIESVEATLIALGLPAKRLYSERFATAHAAPKPQRPAGASGEVAHADTAKQVKLSLTLDGKLHELALGADEHVLDAALEAGLDLPFSCKAGVCSTCRCKVTAGSVVMDKNFTLEPEEVAQGYVLSCQARATSTQVAVDFDHR
jgi:ring-1,2-phenylacetyl-CoA epoxidase subunit PaaE